MDKKKSGKDAKNQDFRPHSSSGPSARPIRERIDKALFEKKPELLVLDFSEVRFMDSSGIGLIIGRSEVCEAIGAHVRLVALSPLLSRLVRLSGIEKIKNLSIG